MPDNWVRLGLILLHLALAIVFIVILFVESLSTPVGLGYTVGVLMNLLAANHHYNKYWSERET